MQDHKAPCVKCSHRSVSCHGSCADYRAWKVHLKPTRKNGPRIKVSVIPHGEEKVLLSTHTAQDGQGGRDYENQKCL